MLELAQIGYDLKTYHAKRENARSLFMLLTTLPSVEVEGLRLVGAGRLTGLARPRGHCFSPSFSTFSAAASSVGRR